MKTLEIGSRVERISGGLGYTGNKGTVIAMQADTVQVKWDDMTQYHYQNDDGSVDYSRPAIRKGKKTWVKIDVVRLDS